MQALQKGFWSKSSQLATRTRNLWLDGAISSLFLGRAETTSLVSRRRWERPSGPPGSFREPSQIEVFEGPGAWRRLLLKAHGRDLETKTARTFPTRQQPSRRWPV